MRGGALDRAREELHRDRPWKARDRLQGLLTRDPADQDVLGLLGQVCFEMRDLPEAGRYWPLTDRDGPDAAAAREALLDRYGHAPVPLIQHLSVRAPISAFPPAAQERLRALQRDAAETSGFRWEPGARRAPALAPESDPWLGRAVAGVGVTIAALALTGLATVVVRLGRLGRRRSG